MTKSELLFEKFCRIHGIKFERIPVSTSKSPDYIIYVDGIKIVIEVKQIDPNPHEEEKIKQFDSLGSITLKSELGKRIRDRITDTAGKFKGEIYSGNPLILVLYNNVRIYKHAEPLDILAGMYGQLCFSLSQNVEEVTKIGALQSGPNKKMTATTNTSISAVGVLKECGKQTPDLFIYHNWHAKIPLNPPLLSALSIKQYRVNDPNNPVGWTQLDNGGQ
jgi:hypothetical protein